MEILKFVLKDNRLRYEKNGNDMGLDYSNGVLTTYLFEGDMKKWYKELQQIADKNPDGFTVELTTLSTNIPTGYVVGLTNQTLDYWETRTHVENGIRIAERAIANYLKFGGEGKPVISIGGWRNPEDGKYYVDIGIIVKSKGVAIAIAKWHKQKAIFNLENFETIEL